MTTQTPDDRWKLIPPQTSGVIVAGNIHVAIARALQAAGLQNEPLLQWTVDQSARTFTVSKAGDVK